VRKNLSEIVVLHRCRLAMKAKIRRCSRQSFLKFCRADR
jgi:hypothetical protein